MIKLIYFEICKLLHRKTVWLTIAGLLTANAVSIYYQINMRNEYGCTLKEVSEAYKKLETKSNQGKMTWIEDQNTARRLAYLSGDTDYSESIDFSILDLIYEHALNAADYENYILGIEEQAEKLKKSSLYSDPDSFAFRDIESTLAAYEHLKGMSITAEFSGGIRLITDSRATDAFVLLSLIILSMHLLVSEREEGTLSLVKTRKNGYLKTILSKIIVLFLSVLLLCVLFYAVNFTVVSNQLGLGNLNSALQSLDGYISSPYKISVRQYLLLSAAAKTAGMLACAGVLFLICIICRNSLFSCITALLFAGAELILYLSVSPHSSLHILKEFNIAALLDTGRYFSDYLNINVLQYPVNTVTAGIITALSAVTVCTETGTAVYKTEKSAGARRNILRETFEKRKRLSGGEHTNLFMHEAYKLLIMNKALLVLSICILLQFFHYKNINYYFRREEMHYYNYSLTLAGELSADKEKFLETELEKFESAEEKKEQIFERYENNEIDEHYRDYLLEQLDYDEDQKSAFERASSQYSELEAMKNRGIRAEYVYQTGWNCIYGAEALKKSLGEFMSVFAVLILMLSSYEAADITTHAESLIVISKRGRKAVLKRKLAASFILGLISSAACFIPQTAAAAITFGLSGFSAPAKSILVLSWAPDFFSAAVFFITYQIIRIIIVSVSAVLILYISRKTKNPITAMFISAAVLILPLGILYLI